MRAGTGTAWRSGTRRRCADPEPLFGEECGVQVLNLQPSARSEEFVAGEVAPGQLLRAVSCERVWTSVLQWPIVVV